MPTSTSTTVSSNNFLGQLDQELLDGNFIAAT